MTPTEGLQVKSPGQPTFVEVCERIRADIRKEAMQGMPNARVQKLEKLLEQATDRDERGDLDDEIHAQVYADKLEERRRKIMAVETNASGREHNDADDRVIVFDEEPS